MASSLYEVGRGVAGLASPPGEKQLGVAEGRKVLKLASFNIQTAIKTAAYHEYLTGGWRHLFPSAQRKDNLNQIATVLRPFDMVGLQEVDGGGARSGFIVQAEYLARQAGFRHWHNQVNRRFGRLALHSNGLLSRWRPDRIDDYALPGIPGRGMVVARFGGEPDSALHVCVLHLALSRRARLKQLGFVVELIGGLSHTVLMGDLNCGHDSAELLFLTRSTRLCDPTHEVGTFPSWKPRLMLDHILVTPDMRVDRLWAVNFACSDHLPIAMEVGLPESLRLQP